VTIQDNLFDFAFASVTRGIVTGAVLWLLWGGIFYLYTRNTPVPTTRILSWLLTGSVLELLIVVPCHVIVRRRHDCSAPAATSFGIATGVAVMLLCFGPSVLLLYKKRLDSYAKRGTN
jgi:EamA domain-containing membrane protein RarD